MNKIHWNQVMMDHPVPEGLLLGWIDESYELVVSGLTRKLQDELQKMAQND